MENTRAIYRCTEENVDGCRSSATEYVSFPRRLTEQEFEMFQECLCDAKRDCENDDTGDMVLLALSALFEACGVKGELTAAPYVAELCF